MGTIDADNEQLAAAVSRMNAAFIELSLAVADVDRSIEQLRSDHPTLFDHPFIKKEQNL